MKGITPNETKMKGKAPNETKMKGNKTMYLK